MVVASVAMASFSLTDEQLVALKYFAELWLRETKDRQEGSARSTQDSQEGRMSEFSDPPRAAAFHVSECFKSIVDTMFSTNFFGDENWMPSWNLCLSIRYPNGNNNRVQTVKLAEDSPNKYTLIDFRGHSALQSDWMSKESLGSLIGVISCLCV